VPLRIAFDLDGVLADMEGRLVREATALFGDRIVQREDSDPGTEALDGGGPAQTDGNLVTPPLLGISLSPRQERRLWRHVASIDCFWESLEEIEPGTVASLAERAAVGRWETIFLTSRPQTAGPTAQVQTQRWLEAKGFPQPSVFVVQGSRGRIAAALALDLVVDDSPENCLDVVSDSDARALLIWRREQELLPAAARRLGVAVVQSMSETLDALVRIDSGPASVPVFDRVRQMLGLSKGSKRAESA
jgi:hypothetical protein